VHRAVQRDQPTVPRPLVLAMAAVYLLRAGALRRGAVPASARGIRVLAPRCLSTFPTVRDERDKDDAAIKSPDALKAGAAGSASLVALGGGLPLGSVLAAGGAPSALLTPGMVTFLQTFPPLAAQACFLAPMDTMKKIRADGDVGSLPLLPFAAMAVNGIGWVTYGVLAGLTGPEASIMDPNAMTIWVPNITAFLFGAYYWKVYAAHSKSSPILPLIGGAGAVGGIGYLGYLAATGNADFMPGTTFLGETFTPHFALGLYLNAVVVAMFGGPLGALKEVKATGNTSLIPFPFAVATFANCSTWALFGLLVVHNPIVWFPNVLGFGSACAQLSLHMKFGINNNPNKEK
jgi:hypothetical protein